MSNLLDARGEPIKPSPKPHRFGFFQIPENCHIKGFGGINGDKHREDQFAEWCREITRARDER